MLKNPKKQNGRKQGGFILSLELIFTATCLLCVLVIGWGAAGAKIVGEFGDIGTAVGSLNQSYQMTGMFVAHPNDPRHPVPLAEWQGSANFDFQDFCDNDPNCACGVIVCIPPRPELPHPGTPPGP